MPQSRWRTMGRVVGVDRDGAWVIFPGWSSRVAVLIKPTLFAGNPEVGMRFHCTVNFGADLPQDLEPKDYEPGTTSPVRVLSGDVLDRLKQTQCCDPVIDSLLGAAIEEIERLRACESSQAPSA